MAQIVRLFCAAAAVCLVGAGAAGCSAHGAGGEQAMATQGGGSSNQAERVPVVIAGRTFRLEPALDDETRMKGLGGRDHIAEDGGMVFVFPNIAHRDFVMRDCPIPIDILYLDGAGRILSLHAMEPEEPRREGEDAVAYEMRLKRYPSRFPTGLVVELRGGKIKELGLKAGDKVQMDIEGLKKRAR